MDDSSKIIENSQIGMSRRLGASSSTQMAEILCKHWRSCGTSRSNFTWTPTGRIGYKKDNSRKFYWNLERKKVTNWWIFACSSKTRIILIGKRGGLVSGWKEAKCGSHVEQLWKNVDLDEPTSFLDHENFWCTQRECKPNEDHWGGTHKKCFESRISAGATEKASRKK